MKTLFVLLPGILVAPEIAFESQLPLLEQYGEIITISYDNNHFDENIIFYQLHKILTQEKKYDHIFFMGVSFGTMCLLRFFLKEKSTYTKKVAGIILFGSVLSADDYSGRLLWKLVPTSILEYRYVRLGIATYMKAVLRGDPSSPQKKLARQSVDLVNKKVLADRVAYVLEKRNIKQISSLFRVPAFFIWWESDFIPEQRRRELEGMLDSITSVTIPGSHGWIWRKRDIVNSYLKTFLEKVV